MSLLVRHPRGIGLTDAGQIFAQRARLILTQREQLKAELAAFANGSRGKIKLYANTAAIAEFLPPRLSKWLSEHPSLAIELEERTSVDIVHLIASGIAEAGLVSDAVNAQDLTLTPIADDRLVLIVPPHHPLSHADGLSLSDVVTEPLLRCIPAMRFQENISQHAAELGHHLNYRIRMSSFDGFCEMVSNGIGVGIVPESVADRFRHKFPFTKRLVNRILGQKRKICLCFKSQAALSPAMSRLLAPETHLTVMDISLNPLKLVGFCACSFLSHVYVP